MSSAIAAMILTALALILLILLAAGRRRQIPTGIHNALEALVVLVRETIAKVALHDEADRFLPYLLTLFVFVLGLNVFGMIPIEPISRLFGRRFVGGTATSVPAVCAGLGALTLLTIIALGLWRAANKKHEQDRWPMPVCLLAAPLLWVKGLAPNVPGPIGAVLVAPLAVLELVGAAAKCFALMIRLAANMFSGHILLVVLMMFAMQAVSSAFKTHPLFLGVSILCVLASAAFTILDLLVAVLQAYIFTFLTAMFLGLYVEGHNQDSPKRLVVDTPPAGQAPES